MKDSSRGNVVMISQPRYLPNLTYLHRIAMVDSFIVLDTVQYSPRDWENRNRIKSPNGLIWLTVPITHESRDQPIATTRIAAERSWTRKHLKSIEACYSKAPHFASYYPRFQAILMEPWEYLVDLNLALTSWLLAEMGIETVITRASELPPVKGSGSSLLLELCLVQKATRYLSGPLGRNYIDAAAFAQASVELEFDDYIPPQYSQLNGPFEPHVSAIDLLFNAGPASQSAMMTVSKGPTP